MPRGSQVFEEYRALGYYSNHVPLQVFYHEKHKENYVVTCVGKAYHVYNCSRLGLVNVSNVHDADVGCLAVSNNLIFTSSKNVVYGRGRTVNEVKEFISHRSDVHFLLPFGKHLLSVDKDSTVLVWDVESQELYTEINFNNKTFHVTCMIHPCTYLNKVLFGSLQGKIQLWNIKNSQMLYEFSGWESAVTALQQTPAVDIIAVGLESGQIIIHDIKFDETRMKFYQDWGPVTAIAFRSDGYPGMMSASAIGHIAVWNMEERRLLSQIRDAHAGSITGMACLPSEPLMVTSAADNSIKIWIFDQPDGSARLLRKREGHSSPPSKITFYSADEILSASQDGSVFSFSTDHDSKNKCLGRAVWSKNATSKTLMPPVVSLAAETSKASDWDNIIAAHRNCPTATVWNFQRSTLTNHVTIKGRENDFVECVSITSCGNFGLLGFSSGYIDMINMQSLLPRGTFGTAATVHKGAVRGVAVSLLNQYVVTVGADKAVKFWRFKSRELTDTMLLDWPPTSLTYHKESCMLAVALDDLTVSIIDTDLKRVVRRFAGHQARVTDMAFNNSGKWLITSSMDCTVKMWDLVTGLEVDSLSVESPVTNVGLSLGGEFLVTAHVDEVGLYLWANKTVYSHVPLSSHMDVVSVLTDGGIKSPEQLNYGLVTLSLLPHSRWATLLKVDVIKQRNKPRQPPKIPKSAPFFLPVVAGLNPQFAIAADGDGTMQHGDDSAISRLKDLSELGKMLVTAINQIPKDCEPTADGSQCQRAETVLQWLKELGPARIDAEIRSLSPDFGGSIQLLACFLRTVGLLLGTCQDFELVQAYLALFLKVHGETIAQDRSLLNELECIKAAQVSSWRRLEDGFNMSLCLVNFQKTSLL